MLPLVGGQGDIHSACAPAYHAGLLCYCTACLPSVIHVCPLSDADVRLACLKGLDNYLAILIRNGSSLIALYLVLIVPIFDCTLFQYGWYYCAVSFRQLVF